MALVAHEAGRRADTAPWKFEMRMPATVNKHSESGRRQERVRTRFMSSSGGDGNVCGSGDKVVSAEISADTASG